MPMKTLYVYMLRCNDDTIYVGVTNDIARRFNEHQSGAKPTAYTATRRPVCLIFVKPIAPPIKAIAYEKKLKKWSHDKKLALAFGRYEELKRLAACKNETRSRHVSASLDLTLKKSKSGFARRDAEEIRVRLRST